MTYDGWLKTVPVAIAGDPLWHMKVYRLALFAAEIGWPDVTKLMKDRRTLELSDQLYRALGSVGSNLSEGYSRSSGKDRARFYEYALGSARESRHWYYESRHILREEVAHHRMELLSQIIRLLLTIIPADRAYVLRDSDDRLNDAPAPCNDHPENFPPTLAALLENIPPP